MIDASSAKKSLKRFVGLVESIMESKDPEQRDAALSELISYSHENSGSIREATTEDTSQLISYLLVDVYKSGSSLLDDLLEAVKEIEPENPIIGQYELVSLFNKGEYTELISQVTADPLFSQSETVMDVLKKSARKSENYGPVVLYLAENGKYDRELFRDYCRDGIEESANIGIIDAFESRDMLDELLEFLELLIAHDQHPTYKLKLAMLYMKLEDEEKLGEMLGRLNPSDFENKQDYLDASRCYEYVADHSKALLYANGGLSSHPSDRDLMLQKAKMLIMLRREGEASETLSQLVETYPKDDESIRLAASLSYKSGQYKDTLKYIGLLGELTELELSDYLMLIDSQIRMSLFDQANESLSSAMAKFGASLDLLGYKLNLEVTINDRNDSYSTALEILKLDPLNPDSLEIKFRYLFDQEEFRDVVEELDEMKVPEVKNRFVDLYATSLIYLNKFSAFVEVLKENSALADNGYVIDAIFYRIRDDDKIEELLDFLKPIKPPAGDAMRIVLNRLRGVRPLYEGNAAQICVNTKSFALGYIICTTSIDFKGRVFSEDSEVILSNPYFKEISSTMDIIQSIYSGADNLSSLSDSPRLLYPMVSALVDINNNQAAREVLDRAFDSRLNDPFYYYYDAILQLRKGNSSAARKSVKKALSRLTNNQFLTLEAEIMLSEGDLGDVKDALVKLAERGLVQNINFEDIYKYIVEKGSYEAGKGLADALAEFGIENIWLNKLLRDVRTGEGSREEALEYSRRVVNAKNRDFTDIRKHVELLEGLGMKDQLLAFLLDCSGPNESATIDLWLGDLYHDRGDFEEAMESYNSAIEKGMDSLELKNLADTLIETDHLSEAAKIISRMEDPGILKIKLYYAQGNTQGIVKLLSTSDLVKDGEEDKLTFIVEKLWSNKLVREALIKAYRREGYLFLGRLVAGKMMESGDYKSAADILENMLKNYPGDLLNASTLSDVYVQLGRITEALELLLNSMKHSRSFEESMLMVNRILKIYYEDRDYDSVLKFYDTNKEFVDKTAAQYIIRSYIAVEEFDKAEAMLGKYEGNLIDRELNSEMLEEIKAKREFSEILIYVRRLLRLEYKAGKTFDMKEALYKAEIPIEKIDEVYGFLKSEQYYSDVNEEKYEILSRDVFQEIAKKTRVESIKDVKINVIFNNLASRDVIVAKNLYLYIIRCMELVREPKIHDEVLTKLLKLALRDHLRPEPLIVAVNLDIGISDALEVIALMRFMEDMDKKGGH